MNLSIRTFYDKSRLLRFSKYVGLHKIGLWIALAFATTLVSIPFVFQFTGSGIDGKVIFGFVIVLLVDIFYVFTYFVLPHLTIDKLPLLGVTIDFQFLDTIFVMNAITKKGEDKSTFKYIDLKKIKESKTEIYLYITKSQAFIVDKSKLGEAEKNSLISHIAEKMKSVLPKKANN